MTTEHVLASWPQVWTQLQHPKPASLQEESSRCLGASFCGQPEPRNVPLGKVQPVLVWRHPSSGSELNCQLSSYVQCLGTHGVLLGLAVASEVIGLHCSS